nr:F-box domain-containing protein [Tanacetum cinerariifolium]
FPSKYQLSPFTCMPTTTVAPRKRSNNIRNLTRNDKVLAFNLGKAGIDLNSSVEDLVYMGSRDTDVYISLHNVDPNKIVRKQYVDVDGAFVTYWRMLFVIPSTNVVKLIGFTKDDDPIVEVDRGRMLYPLQVYDRTSQEFHNVGISADGGSFFIGPYKESLILLNV